MKKIYIEPTIDEVIIKAPTILAGSPGLVNEEVETGDIDARGNDFDWDDEEEY